MSPHHCDFVLSGVSIRASSNLDILRVKFDSKLTFEDHVRVRAWWCFPCLSDNCYFEVGEMYTCG